MRDSSDQLKVLKKRSLGSIRLLAALLFFGGGSVAVASSPAAWRETDRQSEKACIAQSGLRRARVGPATRFSDRILVDARIVSGTYPQRHIKGVKAKMLCLYNRKLKRAEVEELQ
jgi:hypothetical protein